LFIALTINGFSAKNIIDFCAKNEICVYFVALLAKFSWLKVFLQVFVFVFKDLYLESKINAPLKTQEKSDHYSRSDQTPSSPYFVFT